MNGDQLQPGQYAVSTSNRNFEGRQGKGGRTLPGQSANRCCFRRCRRCDRCALPLKDAAPQVKYAEIRHN